MGRCVEATKKTLASGKAPQAVEEVKGRCVEASTQALASGKACVERGLRKCSSGIEAATGKTKRLPVEESMITLSEGEGEGEGEYDGDTKCTGSDPTRRRGIVAACIGTCIDYYYHYYYYYY